MDTKTGRLRILAEGEKPKVSEVMVNTPKPNCTRCKGNDSLPREKTTRAERRRLERKGVSPMSDYYPCPECGGYQ